MGGFSTAMDFLHSACGLPGRVVSAVDLCPLALSAYRLNHAATAVLGDITLSETIFEMHIQQCLSGVQPLLVGGFPCQPLSRQGAQRRQSDSRSMVLPALLRAAYYLQVSGVCLECVPEAYTDQGTQAVLHEFANLMNFTIHQRIVHLHDTWPSRRTRWFALVIPECFGFHLQEMPKLSPAPVVGDLIPFTQWPTWNDAEEHQLRWTEMESQTYKDPAYGSTDRRVDLSQPLPTALHSWGSALYKCPCNCRAQGFHPRTLKAKGLRGVEIISGLWPHASRHIHPKELQFLLGFPPLQCVLSDCRAQLCLLGNSVSPVQVIWILSQLYQGFHLMHDIAPRECICRYLQAIVLHRDVTWPSPIPGVSQAILDFPQGQVSVSFHTGETIRDLIRAEATLQLDPRKISLSCQGLELPEWAYVQERTYQVTLETSFTDFPVQPVPVLIDHLGVRKLYVVPASFSIAAALSWVGIVGYKSVVNEHQAQIDIKDRVQAWIVIVVQLDPAEVEFELLMRLDGLGFDSVHRTPGLCVTETWGGTGLWHVDQLVKSNLLVSWAGSDFQSLTVWLPSFAAAVVELWPSTAEDHLRAWLSVSHTSVYAIVLEQWGWNLLKISVRLVL